MARHEPDWPIGTLRIRAGPSGAAGFHCARRDPPKLDARVQRLRCSGQVDVLRQDELHPEAVGHFSLADRRRHLELDRHRGLRHRRRHRHLAIAFILPENVSGQDWKCLVAGFVGRLGYDDLGHYVSGIVAYRDVCVEFADDLEIWLFSGVACLGKT